MKIQIFPLEIEGSPRIGIKPLGFDKSFPQIMKQIPGSRWTSEERCWHIPYHKNAYSRLKELFGSVQLIIKNQSLIQPISKKEQPKINPKKLVYSDEIIRMEQKLILQRYSSNTIKTYKSFFTLLLVFYPERHPESLTKEDITQFILASRRQKKMV